MNVGADGYFAPVSKTGQANSYQDHDDGDLKKGLTWPISRFTDHADGTVTDNLTKLMWVKDPHSLNGNSHAQKWSDAISFCQNLKFANHEDWRLPNLFEIESLRDMSQFSPCLPMGHPFTNILVAIFWTSTTNADETDFAWFVYMGDGGVVSDPKTNARYVWPVRDGR